MYAVYQTSVPIPEFGAQAGDYLVLDPANPVSPLQVVRRVPRPLVVAILSYSEHLELVDLQPPVSALDPIQLVKSVAQLGPLPAPQPYHPEVPEPWPGPPESE